MQPISFNSAQLENTEKSLSFSRMARYRIVAEGNLEKALEWHHWNAALGETLHTPIQTFELLFRNSLNEQLSLKFGADWYDQINPHLDARLQLTIAASKSELQKMHRPIDQSGMVAQFTFGFWLSG